MKTFQISGVENNIIVNFSLYLEELKQEFQEKGMVVIPNLLDQASAEDTWHYYFHQPQEYWDLALYPDDFNDYGGYYNCYRAKIGDPEIERLEPYVRDLNNQGLFSYIYNRTDETYPVLDVFKLDEFIDIISYITGYENLEFDPMWTLISNYESGHYNGPHIDGINGRVAFIYHLSRNWRPGYGGLFLELTEDQKNTKGIVMPEFNKLVLLDVKNDSRGTPHLVTEVAQGTNNKRLAYTGWYQ